MISPQWTYILVTSFLLSAKARVIESVLELQAQYDFVVVGGGTAGCVVANRLSADTKVKVLLIEAGGSHEGEGNTVIPFLAPALQGSSIDWNFTTTPQIGLDGRAFPYTRGQVLGGSSTVNFLTWNRGSDDVYDEWARITGDDGWSSSKIQSFYLKSNRIVAPADNHDTSGEFDPSAHGDGPVEVSLPGYPSQLDAKVLETSRELGGRFPFTLDLNAGKSLGFSYMQSSIGDSKRSSAATAYLTPSVLNRTNLDVLLSMRATKVLPISKTASGEPIVNTVEVAKTPTGQRYLITASKELILCTGVINTPQLLLLSGIGPKSELEKMGIPSVIDNPSVGQNLTDHSMMPNYFFVHSKETFDDAFRDPAIFGEKIQQYMTSGTGLLVDSPGNTQGFIRLPSNSPIFNKFKDPATGPGSAHTELIFVDGFAPLGPVSQPDKGNFLTVLTVVASPLSRGNVSLASSDPFDKPLIDPAVLTSEFDIFAMVQAMKDTQLFISATPWAGFVGEPLGDLATAKTDESMAAYARKVAVSINHPSGTAAMSPFNAKWGVVNPDLTLKGASGLRVVDASIFPVIPEAHIQAAVYIVAERAAALIQEKQGPSLLGSLRLFCPGTSHLWGSLLPFCRAEAEL